jgi:small subunit ribosomal protein S16
MVKLRLRRKGRKKSPTYDIVVVDSRERRDSAFIERLGYYNPMTAPSTISINADRAIYWLNVGAQPTDVVRAFMSYEGVFLQRHMQFKGKSADEITEAVTKHKETVARRYTRTKVNDARKKAEAAKAAAKGE